MTKRLLAALALASLVACYYGSGAESDEDEVHSPNGGAAATAGSSNGLPCDVDALLANDCRSCHGSQAGATAMNGYTDLVGPSKTQPSKRLVDVAIERMKGIGAQMPPPPTAAVATTVLEQWVAAGTPQGSCGSTTGQSVCTSGTTYRRGENQNMRPGEACISCHRADEGPIYAVMGTVYPTAHEPNDCNGASGSSGALTVVVTGANGKVVDVPVNGVGNFMGGTGITFPAHAKIVSSSGAERAMVGEIPNGDCNTCHTETGANSAPGRIQAP